MFIGITGLHGAGKSYFSHNIPKQYGFKIYYKNDIIAEIYEHKENWQELYREQYKKDTYSLVTNILSKLPLEEDIILDAIHNNEEWNIIQQIVPSAMLILVTSPKEVRIARRPQNPEKDKKRIQYWHKVNIDSSVDCLLTQVSWSFNGNASIETNKRNFEEFLEYAKNKEEIYKEKKLQQLIQENKILDSKIQKAEELLIEYERIQEKSI